MSEADKQAQLKAAQAKKMAMAKRQAMAKKQAAAKAAQAQGGAKPTQQQRAAAARAKAQGASGAAKPARPKGNKAALEKRGILQFSITDEKMLYACFMPFVKGCGIFVPSENAYNIGDELFLLLELPEDKGKFSTAAKVVWVNPKQKMGRREPGIGLQILGRDTDKLRHAIEELLGKKVNSPLPTSTM